jgi:DNA polymerase III gamma/tau subunit
MKEMWKKYKRQIQITGGLCLIAALGIGGYVVVNQDADVQTKVEAKQETQSSNQKIAKTNSKDTSSEKKMDTKQEAEKKTDTKSEKTAEKKETIAKKSENSDNKNSVEKSDKKESAKAEKETGKTESSSKPEQKPSQPESKPEQNSSKPQTKPEQKPSKPQHTHTWKEVTHTINHEEVGHNEQYVIKEAWMETVTEDVYDPWECCNVCGADCTADPSGHAKQHALAGEGGGHHIEYYKTVTRTVEHPAEYGTRWVVDQPAWTETVSDGFFCSGCGTKK